MQILCKYVDLWEKLEDVCLQPSVADRFVWKWTKSGQYTASSAYRSFFVGQTTILGTNELWKASAPPKVKFFSWLTIHGRLWAADRRKRHGLQHDDGCALCGQLPETTDHLLLACVFAREVWWRALHHIHLQHLAPSGDDQLPEWWLRARSRVPPSLSRALDSLVLLITWNLWKERNRRVFDKKQKQVTALLEQIGEEADSWIAAGFNSLALLLAQNG